MDKAEITELLDRLEEEGELFAEPIRRGSLSVGLYRLEAGATDPQEPHAEDEVYYVLSGRAKISVDGETRQLREGDLVYVERGTEHRFFDIEEDLATLVFFAPAYGSLNPK